MKTPKKISVAVILGSDSDLPVVSAGFKIFEKFNIRFCVNIASAHRSPAHVRNCVRTAERAGARVFIAAAGMAAALPGVVAAETLLPVIGIPCEGRSLSGQDALFSIVQMPPGIPVATVAIGRPGAVNAALLAVRILAVSDEVLRSALAAHRAQMARDVVAKDARLNRQGAAAYLKELGS